MFALNNSFFILLRIKSSYEGKGNGASASAELLGSCPVITCTTVALDLTQSRGAVGPPSKRPIAAHHSHSFSKMPESLGLQQCGRCQEGWGQTQRIFLPLRRVLSATEISGSRSTHFFSGSLSEPKVLPGVMPGPCLVVHWCSIQLQGAAVL